MPWAEVIAILTRETDSEIAHRLSLALIKQIGGERITIPSKPTTTEIEAAMTATRYNVASAARQLGVSRSTVYRAMRRVR